MLRRWTHYIFSTPADSRLHRGYVPEYLLLPDGVCITNFGKSSGAAALVGWRREESKDVWLRTSDVIDYVIGSFVQQNVACI